MSRKITTDIFITEAKEVHGDLYDYSKVDYKNSVEKVIIICKTHGEFIQAPANHKKGMGCSKCAAEKFTSNTNEFIQKAIEFHGNKYDYSKVDYKRSHIKVEIICPKHGSFFQTPNKHLNGGCRICANELNAENQKFSKSDFVRNAVEVHGDLYDYSKVDYKTARKKVIIICSKHGEFEQVPDSHVNGGQGCPYCVGKAVGPLNSTEYLYPQVANEWHPAKNSILPSEVSPGSSRKIWFICPKGHEYETNLSHRTSEYKKKTGCPYCAGQKVSSDNNLQARFPAIAKEWHPTKNKLKPFEVMPGTDKKYWWLCSKGHEYKATPDKRTTKDKRTGEGTSCPYCTSQTSTQEMRIMAELDYLGIKILSRYKYNNIEFDVYLPEFSIGIEYDGSYWHKDKSDKDKLKNNFAIKNNIILIRIRECPLEKIHKEDICTVSNASISKEEINLLMDVIGKHTNKFSDKINLYKEHKNFINEDLYNKYLSYAPSPLPEKSLEYLYPEVSKDWDYEKNHPLTPKNFTRGSRYKAWWKCSKGHEWKTSIAHRTHKDKPTGCYKCYIDNMKELRKLNKK